MTDVAIVEENDDEIEEVVDDAAKGEAKAGDEAAQPNEIEEIALEMGWAPQDKWNGSADSWVDAKTFLKRGPTFLKRTLEKQDSELASLKQDIKRMASASEKAAARAYEQALVDLKTQRAEAIRAGDPGAVDHFDKQMDELRKDAPEPPAAPNPDEDPNFKSWLADNAWYGKGGDYKMRAFANQIAPEVGADGFQGAEFYQKITELVREEFPEKFANAARKGAPRVEGAGNGSMGRSGGAKKTYRDLPPEARRACDNFVSDGVLTKEQYVADYFSEE